MRTWITFLMTLLVGSSISYANADAGQVSFEAGYRRDNLSWNHSFPSSDPIVSTSSKFKDLDIFQIGLKGRTTVGCNLYLRANAYWGWILDGDFKQSATIYGSNGYDNSFGGANFNRGFEFSSDSQGAIDDKYVYGVGAAIGYPFYFCDCTTVLAPVIGYAVDEQNVQLESGGFDFSGCDGVFVPVKGSGCCTEKFITRWYGPFVGLDFSYRPCNECWSLYAELEYHWGNFRGKRHNTHSFDFFDQGNHSSHNATGWVFAAGADYDLCNCWTVGFSVKFQDWSASRHRRHSFDNNDYQDYFFSDNSGCCNSRARDGHKWHSYAINLTLGHSF